MRAVVSNMHDWVSSILMKLAPFLRVLHVVVVVVMYNHDIATLQYRILSAFVIAVCGDPAPEHDVCSLAH